MITEWLLKNEIAPIETYGSEGRNIWQQFQNALHKWACSNAEKDISKCVQCGHAITDRINAEVEYECRVRISHLTDFRNAAVEYVYTDTDQLICIRKENDDFRQICEFIFAEQLRRNMSMTIEQLRAERKAHNRAKNLKRRTE